MEKIKKRKRKKYEMAGLFFILPSLIGVSIFILIPFADVVIRSFQSPITRDFVFFHNYMEVFKNAAFKLAATNTIKFVFICIPLLLIISLIIAVLMQRFVRNAYIIKTAFIMSSSRNPKEFIQRRGRLLRRSKNKKYAEIYDFITLPRDLSDVVYGDYESDRTIILGELFRMNEFAKLAENRNKTEVLITEIMNAYGVFFDIDEENKKMEEYYDG